MKIGIVGGTGGMGKGFAVRWCTNHDILIGSRDAKRATNSAKEYENFAKEVHGQINGSIKGNDNDSIAKESDVLILSIQYENTESTCSQLLPQIKDSCIVVSPIVPMTKTERGFEFIPLKENKPYSFQIVEKYMKDKSKLVSAFHVISEKKLADPTISLDYDIFVCGDDKDAVNVINGLIKEIKGLRPIYLGPGALSYFAEMATPLLLNAMFKNNLKNPGIKIV